MTISIDMIATSFIWLLFALNRSDMSSETAIFFWFPSGFLFLIKWIFSLKCVVLQLSHALKAIFQTNRNENRSFCDVYSPDCVLTFFCRYWKTTKRPETQNFSNRIRGKAAICWLLLSLRWINSIFCSVLNLKRLATFWLKCVCIGADKN